MPFLAHVELIKFKLSIMHPFFFFLDSLFQQMLSVATKYHIVYQKYNFIK